MWIMRISHTKFFENEVLPLFEVIPLFFWTYPFSCYPFGSYPFENEVILLWFDVIHFLVIHLHVIPFEVILFVSSYPFFHVIHYEVILLFLKLSFFEVILLMLSLFLSKLSLLRCFWHYRVTRITSQKVMISKIKVLEMVSMKELRTENKESITLV